MRKNNTKEKNYDKERLIQTVRGMRVQVCTCMYMCNWLLCLVSFSNDGN